jgi:hypothetical protein
MTSRRLSRRLAPILLIAEIALLFSICRDIAYVSTRRLYLNHRVEEVTLSSSRMDRSRSARSTRYEP